VGDADLFYTRYLYSISYSIFFYHHHTSYWKFLIVEQYFRSYGIGRAVGPSLSPTALRLQPKGNPGKNTQVYKEHRTTTKNKQNLQEVLPQTGRRSYGTCY
jgi:hypothetical protein